MNPKDLGFTVNQIIRYGYGGVLLMLVIGLISPSYLVTLYSAFGPFLGALAIYTIGIFIYLFYRPILGQRLIWPTSEVIHGLLDYFWYTKTPGHKKISCRLEYLNKHFGITTNNRIDAYRLIRNSFNDKFSKFEIEHSEIHLLYITFLILFAACLYLLFIQIAPIWFNMFITIFIILTTLTIFICVIIIPIFIAKWIKTNYESQEYISIKIIFIASIFLLIVFILLLYLFFIFHNIQCFTNISQNLNYDAKLAIAFLIISILSLIFGMFADIDLCRKECAELKKIPEDQITNILQQSGFII
jgi:hypothetical protein